jgi:hypothetical protein
MRCGARLPSVPDDAPQSTGWIRSAIEWLFRDRETGGITIAQFPNLPLWIFLGTVVARWVVPEDNGTFTALRVVALAALGWWAVDEVVRGVNPWRRFLGVLGCGIVLRGALAF